MIDAHPQRGLTAFPARRRAAIMLLAGLLALGGGPSAALASSGATPATAPTTLADATGSSTSSVMADDLLRWLNRDRAAMGLLPLRGWSALADLAAQRATRMAASGTLSHTAAGGDPGAALKQAGLQWYAFGEIIGETSYPWGPQAAANLYSMWTASPPHHDIMFSNAYNYVGVGIARASDGSTWASLLFTESADHTPPVASNGPLKVSGTAIAFGWSGSDPQLASHTAGLRGFNVQYRVNGGSWRSLRHLTASTSVRLAGRKHGTVYSFRVQAVDRRGNLSAWTAEKRVRVP